MGKIVLKSELKTINVRGVETEIEILDNEQFKRFNAGMLGLGNISLRSTQVEAIAAVYDLSGFTNFCSKVDSHLSVPEYLSRFLDWLFGEVKQRFVKKSYKEGKELWAELPLLAKFLGDGVLFLWDTCVKYRKEFYPEIKKVVVEPPDTLRCGIARGRVFSVGNGEDYVGPCINIASRLQKLSLLTFCVSRRGFDFEKHMHTKVAAKYVVKSVSLP